MPKIFMVRHGQSEANARQIVAGQQETPLTEVGKHQAKMAGEGAKSLGIDLILCSTMGRAQETARIIAGEIGYPVSKIQTDPRLIERKLGDLEGKSYAHDERHNGNYPETESYKNVESLEHLHQRVYHVFHELLKDTSYKNVLIVCHQNVGRMLYVITRDKSAATMYEQPRLDNGVIYQVN